MMLWPCKLGFHKWGEWQVQKPVEYKVGWICPYPPQRTEQSPEVYRTCSRCGKIEAY